jgi:hypothetical protein
MKRLDLAALLMATAATYGLWLFAIHREYRELDQAQTRRRFWLSFAGLVSLGIIGGAGTMRVAPVIVRVIAEALRG